jgi:hypothetical protein
MSDFAVSYWHGVPPDRARREDYETIAKAGFTVAQVSGSPEQILQQLGWCASLGITAMVMDGRMPNPRQSLPDDWKDRLAGIVEDYQGSSALWGYYISDEPSTVEYERLREITHELRRLDPERPSYINLYPNYASEQQLGCATYDEHVQRYVDEVQPPLVSYDHYCFFQDGVHRDVYFENLRIVRDHSQRVGLEFWQIVLASQLFDWPELSEADVRWQVWTSLAYGARGISYYVYSGIDGPVPHWNAIVDPYGHPTDRYPVIRRTNLGVVAVGPHLMKMRHVGVAHGSDTQGKSFGEGGVITAPPPERIVVGEFARDDGGAAMIVVNDDLEVGTMPEIHMDERFSAWRRVDRVTGNAGPAQTLLYDGDGPTLEVRLAPGDGTLILLEG